MGVEKHIRIIILYPLELSAVTFCIRTIPSHLLSYFCCKQKYLIAFAGPQNCYDKLCENGKTLRRVS